MKKQAYRHKTRAKQLMEKQRVPMIERTGKDGRPRIPIIVRKLVMQLLTYGVKVHSIKATLSTVLHLVGIDLDEPIDDFISERTLYRINSERAVVGKAHVAQEWMASTSPDSVINQADGTSSNNQTIQVL